MVSSYTQKDSTIDDTAKTVKAKISHRICLADIVKLQWLEHLWNHEKMFET